MESMLQPENGVPPIEPGAYLVEEPQTKWPRVIGVISLCYAILGLLCAVSYAASSLLTEFFMRMGGMTVAMPTSMKIIGVVSSVLMLALGILMIMGSVGLMRRKRSGVLQLKRWALLRVVLSVIGLAVAVLSAPTAVQFQKSVEEAQIKMFEQNGQPGALTPKSDEQHWFQHMVASGIMTAMFTAYPVFLGFYLSRRKVTDEVQTWR
jgi:hypothetical protein